MQLKPFQLSRSNRFKYAKAYVLLTAPLAVVFALIWLLFVGVLIHGFVAPSGSHVIIGLFGSVAGLPLLRIFVRNYKESLRDYRTTRRQVKGVRGTGD